MARGGTDCQAVSDNHPCFSDPLYSVPIASHVMMSTSCQNSVADQDAAVSVLKKSPARTRSSFQPEPSNTVQTRQEGLQKALLKGYTCIPASNNDADGRVATERLHHV